MDNRLTHRYFPAVLLVTAAIFALAYESYPVQIAKATGLSVSETARLTRFQNKTIKVIKQGFGQKERQLGFGFVVENPNAGLLIEGSQYQIAAYDAEGTVVKTESGYIDILLPSQKLGVGGTMFLDEGVTVSKIEVQISDGKTTASDPVSTFVVDAVTYTSGQFSSQATGIVSNPYKSDITELRVSSVAYDAAGDIIGGGFTFLNFVLANGKTGIKVPVTSAKKVALVELYPIVSSLSLLNTEESLPVGATSLMLSKQGYGQNGQTAGFGLVVENPNADFSIEGSQYHATAYAKDGNVVAVEEGYIEVLLPKQTLGIGGTSYLEKGVTISRFEIQMKPGKFKNSNAQPFLTSEKVKYQASQYSPKVTGQIISTNSKDVTNVLVSAIAYNKAGEIIGGGFTFLDFVPANGKAAVEVQIKASGKPDTVELYAVPSSLSETK